MFFKNCFVFLPAFAVFITSCSKSGKEAEVPQVNSKVLPGVWEYRSGFVQIANADPSIFAPGNGNLWEFSGNRFERIYKDSVYESGTYSTAHTGTDLNTNRTVDQLILNGQPADSYQLANDTLHFFYGWIGADGTVDGYVKISDDTSFILGH